METVESEREEGEITDDELEDVSDCSITSPVRLGKSVSAPERLRSVSLSSISDSDLEGGRSRKNGHYIRFLKTSTPYISLEKNVRRRRHVSKPTKRITISSSDSEDEKLDRKTLRQLKEAVHIDTSKDIHQNSLRTRLKALIQPEKEEEQGPVQDGRVSEADGDQNSQEADKSDSKKNNEDADVTDDKELAELRLEALKSAMLKKHWERKKRKAMEEDSEKLENDEINKENAVDNINRSNENGSGSNKKMCLEQTKRNEGNISIEEDVDIMRAMLLASMSKKITAGSELLTKSAAEAAKFVAPKPITRTIINKPVNVVSNPIKRTIKNIYFTNNKVVNNVKTAVNNNVFKPPLPSVEPLIININNDSDSDMDIEDLPEDDLTKSVTDFLKQQRAQVEAKKSEEKLTHLDKSAVSLLPFSQQIEYNRLKQQLNARKVVRLHKVVQRGGDAKLTNKTIVRSKFTIIKQNNAAKERIRVARANKLDKDRSSSLQQTLNDVQMQKDGRLQVKGKYQELAAILKKVNQVSVERKRYENQIKHLLQELEKTKQKFSASHQNFKNLVEELIRKKESIDKRTSTTIQKKSIVPLPPKTFPQIEPVDRLNLENKTTLPSPPNQIKSKTLPESIDKNCNVEQRAESKSDTDIHQIVDPNDLNDQIMSQNKISVTKSSSLPKYVSPLDKREDDFLISDPLAMLCPFDLLGVCKDKECTYKHCS